MRIIESGIEEKYKSTTSVYIRSLVRKEERGIQENARNKNNDYQTHLYKQHD